VLNFNADVICAPCGCYINVERIVKTGIRRTFFRVERVLIDHCADLVKNAYGGRT